MSFIDLLEIIPKVPQFHSPHGPLHRLLSQIAKGKASEVFGEHASGQGTFGDFGELIFPFRKMGKISSLDLFGLDELVLFSFYWVNRGRYKRVLDLGANIGLHSIMLSRCGYDVISYEPDPMHFDILNANLKANGCEAVICVNEAVSVEKGEMEFVRVLGNTTGSHLAGSKKDPYGELKRFNVPVEEFAYLMRKSDLMKIDVEGHERPILCGTNEDDWVSVDAMVEIGTAENASAVYEHFASFNVNLFSQKTGWRRVEELGDMPTSYRDGSLFISSNDCVPWAQV